jgi:O-antigen ligase
VPTWPERLRSPLAPLVAASAVSAIAVGVLSGKQPQLGLLCAVGVVFVALVLVNLQVGFAVMVMFAYLEVLSVLGGVSLAKVAGVLIAIAWLATVSTGASKHRNLFVAHPGFSYLVLAFVGWSALSVAWSESSSAGATSVMRYALNALLLPIAFTAVRDRRNAIRIFAAIVVGAGIAAVSAIASPPPPESAISGRVAGTVGDPNELAAALLVGLAIATAFLVNRHISRPLRFLSGVAAVLCLAGILVSLSRGGLIGGAFALLIAIVMGGRWRGRVLSLCGALAVLAVGYFALFASLPAKERVLDVSAQGGTGRLDLWTVALRMIQAHPFNGIGTGQFPISSVHYLLRPGLIQNGAFILSTPKVAHNTYLNVLAELGVFGGSLFIAMIAFSVGCAVVATRRLTRAHDECMEILARGFVVALGGYLATLMFLSESTEKLFWILMAIGPALLAVATAVERDVQRSSPAVAPP